MKVILQRVSSAGVTIDGSEARAIGAGLVALVGFGHSDGQEQADYLAKKMTELRIFEDENGQMNRSLLDIEGDCLIVPNFTLYANAKKGRRPSFVDSMAPDGASALFDYFAAVVGKTVKQVKTGCFGAHMLVEIQNDGPVTLMLDTDQLMPQRAP